MSEFDLAMLVSKLLKQAMRTVGADYERIDTRDHSNSDASIRLLIKDEEFTIRVTKHR